MTEYIYIALLSGIVFFIFKLVMNKRNKVTESNEKDLMKDSVYVTIIVGLILFAKDNYFNKSRIKTQVFTNEPAF
jgi:hypothetical protein